MKRIFKKLGLMFVGLFALVGVAAVCVVAQQQTAVEPDRAALEESFRKTMDGVTFVGRWCLIRDGKLTPPKEEKYTIKSANKIAGDSWIINARIEFGDNDVTVPVPVKVLWAGDTPVITVTKLGIPGIGTYTARVVVYDGAYAGTWSGPDYGGLLNGAIVPGIAGGGSEESPAGDKDTPDAPEND